MDFFYAVSFVVDTLSCVAFVCYLNEKVVQERNVIVVIKMEKKTKQMVAGKLVNQGCPHQLQASTCS